LYVSEKGKEQEIQKTGTAKIQDWIFVPVKPVLTKYDDGHEKVCLYCFYYRDGHVLLPDLKTIYENADLQLHLSRNKM